MSVTDRQTNRRTDIHLANAALYYVAWPEILSNSQHLFRQYLSEQSDYVYLLRQRTRNRYLITKTAGLNKRHFLV